MSSVGFFCYSRALCTSSILVSLSWLSCILPFLTTQPKDPCPHFICTSLSWLSWLCLLSFTVQHTQHKHPCTGAIRTRNPSKRSAADPRLRLLGYWDRQDSTPRSQQPSGLSPAPSLHGTATRTSTFFLAFTQFTVRRIMWLILEAENH